MIRLDPSDRAAIDAAIDVAFDRLESRAAGRSPGLLPLLAAMRRAADGGKRFRPALVVASFRSCGGASHDALYEVAAAFELLHTAFVVHDDVIDRDIERRGIPNVAGEFVRRGTDRGADSASAALLGEAAGILAGDLLLHEATRTIALAALDPFTRESLLGLLDDAVLISAAGELADVENSIGTDYPDAPAVLGATLDKTAEYSFAAPLRAGAVLAGASDETADALARAGTSAGLAFQLVDDLIGAFGSAADAGKGAGADLRTGKRTPLVTLARESTRWPEVSDALADAWTGPVAVRAAQQVLERSGARERMRVLVDGTLAEARTAAADDALPAQATLLLAQICDAISDRIPEPHGIRREKRS